MPDTDRSLYVQDANGRVCLLEPVMWSDSNEWHGELPQEADVTLYRMRAGGRSLLETAQSEHNVTHGLGEEGFDSGDFDEPCDMCDGGWVDDPMGLGGPTVCVHCGGAG